MIQASFSTEACLHSVGVRVHEKKATGRPAWFSVVTTAVSEASVSTIKGIFWNVVGHFQFHLWGHWMLSRNFVWEGRCQQ